MSILDEPQEHVDNDNDDIAEPDFFNARYGSQVDCVAIVTAMPVNTVTL